MSNRLDPRRISGAVVLTALAEGWRQLRGCLKPAAGFAAVFVLIGVLIFALLLRLDLAQMILPFAGVILHLILRPRQTLAERYEDRKSTRLNSSH